MDSAPPISLPTKKPKKPKKIKPSYAQFVINVNAIIVERAPQGPKQILKMLEDGFLEGYGKVPLTDLLQIIHGWGEADQLAVHLAVKARTGKLKPLSARILQSLRESFVIKVAYPSDTPTATSEWLTDFQRRLTLYDWLQSLGKNFSSSSQEIQRQADHDSAAPTLNEGIPNPTSLDTSEHSPQPALTSPASAWENWLRMAFVCLLSEPSSFTLREGTFLLLEQHWESIGKKKPNRLNTERGFLQFSESILSKPNPPRGPLGQISVAANHARIIAKELERLFEFADEEKNSVLAVARAIEEENDALKINLQGREEDLLLAAEREEQLRNQIRDRESELTAEKDRYQLLEQYWMEESKRRLAGQASGIKEQFDHELTEAVLSLDRDTPNIQMALNRVNRMREKLNKMGGEQ